MMPWISHTPFPLDMSAADELWVVFLSFCLYVYFKLYRCSKNKTSSVPILSEVSAPNILASGGAVTCKQIVKAVCCSS